MTDQQGVEEIPSHLIVTELEAQLTARTSDLVVANARIRTRDHTIDLLRGQLNEAHHESKDYRLKLDEAYEKLYGKPQ